MQPAVPHNGAVDAAACEKSTAVGFLMHCDAVAQHIPWRERSIVDG